MHVAYIHRARAIAIMMIVTIHCAGYLDWSKNHELLRLVTEIFQNGTVIFFLIAGFLFQHLSDRFEYRDYLARKVTNVIVPYIVISAPGIMLLLSKPYFLQENPELQGAPWWQQVAFLYVYGGSQLNYVLWFVPVMTTFYLLAPVFMRVLKRPGWFWLLIALIPLSVIEHRTRIQKYHHLQLELYFLSAYMTGMWAGLYRDRVIAFVRRYEVALWALYLTMVFGHYLFTTHVGTYVDHVFSAEQGRIDWIFLEKMLLFFLLITLLKRFDHVPMPRLDYIATVSFAIFFVHIYVLHLYSSLTHWQQQAGSVWSLAALFALTMAGSLGIAIAARTVLGRSSRLVIGA